MDGALSAIGAGAGIVIVTPEGIRLENFFRLGFKASNNEGRVRGLACWIEDRLRHVCPGH